MYQENFGPIAEVKRNPTFKLKIVLKRGNVNWLLSTGHASTTSRTTAFDAISKLEMLNSFTSNMWTKNYSSHIRLCWSTVTRHLNLIRAVRVWDKIPCLSKKLLDCSNLHLKTTREMEISYLHLRSDPADISIVRGNSFSSCQEEGSATTLDRKIHTIQIEWNLVYLCKISMLMLCVKFPCTSLWSKY